MIVQLTGNLIEKHPGYALLDVHGVGYGVNLSLAASEHLPPLGTTCTLLTHLIVREDEQTLFGFLKSEERELFRLLLTVSGIGPRTAIAILGNIPAQELLNAIASGDTKRLTLVNGIGKKSAQRLILELREKVTTLTLSTPTPENHLLKDAILALTTLGFPQEQALRMAQETLQEQPNLSAVGDLVKAALAKRR